MVKTGKKFKKTQNVNNNHRPYCHYKTILHKMTKEEIALMQSFDYAQLSNVYREYDKMGDNDLKNYERWLIDGDRDKKR